MIQSVGVGRCVCAVPNGTGVCRSCHGQIARAEMIACYLCGSEHSSDMRECYCCCSRCGGEKDGNGDCANYCY